MFEWCINKNATWIADWFANSTWLTHNQKYELQKQLIYKCSIHIVSCRLCVGYINQYTFKCLQIQRTIRILLITRLATRNTATNASAGGQVSIECAEKHKNADNIRTKLFPRQYQDRSNTHSACVCLCGFENVGRIGKAFKILFKKCIKRNMKLTMC